MLYPHRVNVMTKLARILAVLSAATVLAPAISIAQDDWETEPAPQTPEPETLPPPPAETQAQPAPEASAAVPPGQWVYTQQYGWIWMPYADQYTQVPANGYGSPYVYVYSPGYSCWTWLAAPWVWGIGAWPYFGFYGPSHYAWYGHGYWRYPDRWHYAPSIAPAWSPRLPRPGYSASWAGARGAPSRGGYGYRTGAPSRGAPTYRAPAPYRGGSTYRAPAPYRGGSSYQAPAPHRGGASIGRGVGSGFVPRPQGAMSGRGNGGRGGFAVRPGNGGGRGGGWRGGHGRG
jgi:translation initiation factor IF-2